MERIEEIKEEIIALKDVELWDQLTAVQMFGWCNEFLAAIEERDKMLKMKQDDWIAVCKELEQAEAKITEMAAILEVERNGKWSAINREEQAEWRATYWEDMAKSEMKEREQAEARVGDLNPASPPQGRGWGKQPTYVEKKLRGIGH